MTMVATSVLLTNDDGPKSPFLRPFAAELAASDGISSLQIAVPAEEQSWIGQSVSRFKPVYVTPHDFDLSPSRPGQTASESARVVSHGYLVSGTPADCTGLGVSHLFATRPDVVISGVNIGTNAGTPFVWNSGTIGAARQGACFGCQAIALSSLLPPHIFERCREDDPHVARDFFADFERIAQVASACVQRLLLAPVWHNIQLFSVNLPWEADSQTEWRVSPTERLRYRPLYTPLRDGAYAHHFHGFFDETGQEWQVREEGDLSMVKSGFVTISPLAFGPQLSEQDACAWAAEALQLTAR